MTTSPTFGRWPTAGQLLIPVVPDDGDAEPNEAGASAYFESVAGELRIVLPDGSRITVGPSAAPAPVIAPRAVVSVQSNLPDPPTLVYEQGSGIVLGIIQNPISFTYVLTCSVPISNATCAVIATIKEQGPFQSMLIDFPGGGDLRFQGREVVLDGEGGFSVNAVSLNFSFALY